MNTECKHCGAILESSIECRGKSYHCPNCDKIVKIPKNLDEHHKIIKQMKNAERVEKENEFVKSIITSLKRGFKWIAIVGCAIGFLIFCIVVSYNSNDTQKSKYEVVAQEPGEESNSSLGNNLALGIASVILLAGLVGVIVLVIITYGNSTNSYPERELQFQSYDADGTVYKVYYNNRTGYTEQWLNGELISWYN